jgi:type III secretory pathway component EscS
MDSMDSFIQPLKVTDEGKAYLRETAKWAKFLAIVGLVFSILIMIIGVFAGTFISNIMAATNPQAASLYGGGMGVMIGVVYVALGAIYIIPCYYLLKFANQAKAALNSDDSNLLAEALGNHKSVYKFMGVLMIILLSLYALIIVFAIIGGGMAMFMK